MQLLNKESLLDFCLLCYFLLGLFSIAQINKKLLMKSSLLIRICFFSLFFNIFLLCSSVLFSPLFWIISIENSNFAFFFKNFLTTFFTTTILCLFLNAFSYFYYENRHLNESYEKITDRPKIDSLKLSSLIFLCILSIFVIVDCSNEYMMNIFNLRLTMYQKFTGFYFGLFLLVSHYIVVDSFLKFMIYSPAKKLKRNFNIDFEFGIFQNTLINEELVNNTDELQYLVERYKMTGKKLPRNDKERLNDLISKQNLLVHRKNLTNQFVTKKAKIIFFFKKITSIISFTCQNLISLIFLFSFSMVHLRFFYHEDTLFDENCWEMFHRFLQRFWYKHLSSDVGMCISIILIKTIFLLFVFNFCKNTFFPSLRESKALPMREEDIEIEDEEEDAKKNINYIKDGFFFGCFVLLILMFICLMMPRYTLFLPDDVCNLNFWNQENFLVLSKKCKATLIGEIYIRIMQRNEIKAIAFILNVVLILRGFYSMGRGFWKKRNKKKE